MQVSLTADRIIHQYGDSLGDVLGCTIEQVDDTMAERIMGALATPNGGVTLSPDHQTVTALPVPPPPPPDPAVVAAEQQRAAAVAHLLNSPLARDTQISRDALALVLGVQSLTIPLTQDATAADIRILNPPTP